MRTLLRKFIVRNVTVNVERYREMLSIFFFRSKMQELYLHDICFQQDSATCHTARVTKDLLRGEFTERFILRSGSVNWLPTSSDLTPLNYFCITIVVAVV